MWKSEVKNYQWGKEYGERFFIKDILFFWSMIINTF